MPDLTVSFTDAQWTRVVAASDYIKGEGTSTITADELEVIIKNMVQTQVQDYERQQLAPTDF
jgi:hypothetical protein|tara:strand:+ start:487 stop:672 length:186 start_codon:yes stop_codon:yes gene_type:complete